MPREFKDKHHDKVALKDGYDFPLVITSYTIIIKTKQGVLRKLTRTGQAVTVYPEDQFEIHYSVRFHRREDAEEQDGAKTTP